MFDLNEPADEPAAELAPEQKRQQQEETACSALSLLAESAGRLKKLDVQEDKLDNHPTECRGLSPVSSEDNDEISSAAKEWSLRMKPPSCAEAISRQAAATERSSSWPRSERPSLIRSGSLHMLLSDGPKSPVDTNVDSASLALRDSPTEDGKMCLGPEDSKRDETTPGRAETSSRPGKNLMFECEFLQLKTNESNMEVSHDEDLASTAPPPFSILNKELNGEPEDPHNRVEPDGAEVDLLCIDAFGQHDKNDTREVSDRIKQANSKDPLLEDSRFGTFWRGQINFQGLTVTNLVAGCTRAWQDTFKNRKLPIDLNVQRFAGTEKFLSAVKEYMAEPAVRVIQRSNTSSQNYNKLVQVLLGGSTGIECKPDISLEAPPKGPSIAIIPLYDEGNTWIAELYLVSASILSDAEPGELNVSDEDVLYAFLSVSADLNESFTGLKDGGATYIDSGKLVAPGANETSQHKLSKKQPSTSGEAPVDKRVLSQGGRASRASSELSSDPRQDLEEGQLVGEEQGAKEVICTTYERRKRYYEDEKKIKLNGEADAKTRDRHRHRDREQDRERARRDRDRDVDHRDRDRDRESAYTRSRSGNYDYLSRLDSKVIRHRDADKDRSFRDGHRDSHWENGDRGGSTRERFRDSERSRSREREKERDRAAEKISKELTRSRSGIKSLVTESSKSKPVFEVNEKSLKKRERSPVELNRVNGKRLKDGNKDAFGVIDESRSLIPEKKGEDVGPTDVVKLVSKPSPYAEVDSDFYMRIQNRDKGDASRQLVQDSDELKISSLDTKTKNLGGLISSNQTCSTMTEVDEDEVFCELLLDGFNPDTRSWLASKQNAVYLREEYGVTLLRKEISSSEMANNDQSQDALHLKLSLFVSETCDVAEAKYFVHHAADVLKGVAQHGVYCKSLWYPGPVQPFAGEAAPPIHKVVMKIKGDDGKNLDRIQDATGVMIGVVLDADSKKGVKTGFKASVVGLRLKCSRRKGLIEATQQAQALLGQVSGFFAKDMDVPSEDIVVADGEGNEVKPKRGTSRPLYVTRMPEYASARMLRAIFENVLRERLKKDIELPPGFENSTEMVVDVKYEAEDSCAFVEFANDDLVEGALHLYAGDNNVFYGLKVELPSPAALKTYELLQGAEPGQLSKFVSGRKTRVGKEAHASGDSEGDYILDGEQIRSTNGELGQPSRKPVKPLFLTELIRNATSDTVQRLFEDVITDHINPSLVNNNSKSLVLAVRHIPSRGCMFVDLATPELVDFMLDLHNRKPEVFGHMKMELGRSHMPFGESVEKKRSFNSLEKSRSGRTLSPPRSRRRGEDADDYDDIPDYGRQPLRKQRSDPEKTVYADHLPENSSEILIRRVFERVLLKHMTSEQRLLWDEVVTEVRHVKTKYCAFVVFVSEDLARLALELYNKDEEIFDRMRLKPHFNSRLEDMYKDEPHERDEEAQSSLDHRGSHTGSEDHYYEFTDSRGRIGIPRAGGFKEVDRRRSVYIDKIPEKYPESAIKEILDKFLKRKGRGSPSYIVSNFSFFRDKYDQSKLCAFVEVKNENAVQDLLECYAADEEAFEGMRIRPAVKYS